MNRGSGREVAVRSRDLLRVGLGLLFLQAFFNVERRQGVGWAAALAPLVRLWSSREDRAAFLARHAVPFNTNPAMAGPIAGVIARLEERAANGEAGMVDRVHRMKSTLVGPLAGIGDAFLWKALRAGGGLFAAGVAAAAGAVGPLLFLVLYNAGHLAVRIGGVFWGYRHGDEIPRLLRNRAILLAVRLADPLVAVGLAAVAVGVLRSSGGPAGAAILLPAAAVAGYFLPDRFRGHGSVGSIAAIMVGLLLAEIVP